MAELITYREAVAEGIARELRRDPSVVCIGEDIGAGEGVFKTTAGLFAEFGPTRIWDTPISEQAIVGAAMGAAMTGVRPIAEIMFSDFLACCWDFIANEMPKVRYMTGGQVSVPDAAFAHVFVTQGSIELEGSGVLAQGDAARITRAQGQRITALAGPAEVLIWQMNSQF